MNILQLCKKFPYPTIDGETIAITNLSKSLNKWGCEVSLLAMNTSKHFFDTAKLPYDYNHYKSIQTVYVNNRLNPFGALASLIKNESYHLERFRSKAFDSKLVSVLQDNTYDIILIESIQMAHYIPTIRRHSTSKIVMKCHNVEFEIWERIASNSKSPFKKWYISKEAELVKAFEIKVLEEVDDLIFLTKRDESVFKKAGYKGNAIINPSSLQLANYQPNLKPFDDIKLSIGFIGSLDWIPNIEGLRWFLDNVWDKILATTPNVEFHIAGRNPQGSVRTNVAKKIYVHGEVESATAFMNQHPVLLVPIISGSGIRIKILEALALSRTIITTTIGLEGINAQHGEEVLIADTPKQFVDNIKYINSDRTYIKNLGIKGHEFVRKNYNVDQLTRKLIKKLNPSYPLVSNPAAASSDVDR